MVAFYLVVLDWGDVGGITVTPVRRAREVVEMVYPSGEKALVYVSRGSSVTGDDRRSQRLIFM